MHLGIMAKTFPRSTFEKTLDAIADRGITHVQFNLSCAGLPTLPERADEDLFVWIARSFRERGLTMAAISGTFNLCDPDEARRAENLHRLGVLAAACRWLDTRIITLCTGTLDPEDMWKWHPGNVRRSTWETLVHSMREAVKLADRHEVTLAFEPERNNVVNSVGRARMLLDQIGSPWLKVVLDPANLMTADDRPRLGEILDEAREWLGPDVVLAHAKIPPYATIGDELASIRDYLERHDPEPLGWRVAMTESAMTEKAEGLELSKSQDELLSDPIPQPLVLLHEFYDSYMNSLRHISFAGSSGYSGSVIMHGMAEDEVAVIHRVLTWKV